MASTKSQTSSRTNNQTGLQKMYIFNEPAFQKIRHEVDNEKYLSELDQALKKVLYDRTSPKYKKWLQYRELLTQYFNFRNFMNESQTNEDEVSTRQLKLEQRIQQLENQLKTSQDVQPQSSLNNISQPMEENEKESFESPMQEEEGAKGTEHLTPIGEKTIGNINARTIRGTKRTSLTPPQQSTPKIETRRRLSFGQPDAETHDKSFIKLDETNFDYVAPAGHEQIFGLTSDESDEQSNYMDVDETANKNTQMEDSGELLRIFDNELIGKNTLKQRLDDVSETVRKNFLINNEYPKRTFNITYHDEDDQQDKEMIVNGMNVTIVNGNVLRIVDRTGSYRIYNIKEDSLNNIRNFLIDFHTQIDKEVEENKKIRGEYISTKPYNVRDDKNDENMKIVKFKNSVARIPNEMLDEVINLINELVQNQLASKKVSNIEIENQFKKEVAKMKKHHQRYPNILNVNQSFAVPADSTGNISRPLSASAAAHQTPNLAMKRKASELQVGEQTNKAFKQPAKVKPSFKTPIQKGNGFKTNFKWKSI